MLKVRYSNQFKKDYKLIQKRGYDINKLTKIIQTYGEEKYASSIAEGIIKARANKEIKTTLELAEIIKDNVTEKYRIMGHPARKVFQAIRIEFNDELNVF